MNTIQTKILAGLIFCLITSSLSAQEKNIQPSQQKFFFKIGGGLFHQITIEKSESKKSQIKLPAYLAQRRKYESGLANRWNLNNNKAPDSPFGHGTSYVTLFARYSDLKNFTMNTSITADHRGYSFGVYNQKWLAFYPTYFVDYKKDKKSKLLATDTQLAFQLGTFEDCRYYEGLTLYNMDFQGGYGHFQIGHLRFSHLHIGDLYGGIGLNINDLTDNRISLEALEISHSWKMDVKLGIADYQNDWDPKKIDAMNFSIGMYPSRQIRFYAEYGYRFSYPDFDFRLKSATLLGLFYKKNSRRYILKSRIEHRYYGGMFNYRLNSETRVHYRNTRQGSFGNYIGDQFYPLKLYNRPFSQWAAFTEYHKRFLNVLTWQCTLLYRLHEELFLITEFDLNTIWAEAEKTFTYPFFNFGFAGELSVNTYLIFSITNKTINLDKHYPTCYLLKYPVFQLEFRRELPWSKNE